MLRIRSEHVAHVGEMYTKFVRKSTGKRLLRRPRHRREDIRLDLRQVGWEHVD